LPNEGADSSPSEGLEQTAIQAEVKRQYKVWLAGRPDSVPQRFYAITVGRQLRNPVLLAISERARALFS
jgi:hypothetical protein